MTGKEYDAAKARLQRFETLRRLDEQLELLQKHIVHHTTPDKNPAGFPSGIRVMVDASNESGNMFGSFGDGARVGTDRSFPEDLVTFTLGVNLSILSALLKPIAEARTAVAMRAAGL